MSITRPFSFIILAAFAGILFVSSALQAQMVYTWRDAVKEAAGNHPDLAAAREDVRQSEADASIAAAGFLPQVDANAGTGTSDSDEDYSYGVSASQLIFDSSKTSSGVKAARRNITVSRYNTMVESSNVRLRLREAFIGLLHEQALLRITGDIAARRKDSLEQINLRYEAGREHKGALLTAQANLAQAEADVRQAARRIDLARRRLNKELGRKEFFPVDVQGTFDVSNPETEKPDFEQLSETTPFLQALIARKEAARYNVGSAKAGYWPAVYADADIGRSDDEWPPHEESWSAGVKVTWPLFEGGARRASVRKAESILNEARADELSGRDGVIVTLNETWASLQDAIDNAGVQSKFLQSAETRAKISQAQYANGLISFDDWIIIEDNLVRTQKSFLEAQVNASLAEADWVQAKGGTLENEN